MEPLLLTPPGRVLRAIDDVLRGEAGSRHPLAPIVVGGAIYGAAMGTFGGFAGDRGWQVAFSAAKVPILLVATPALALPSFFVLNTLAGLRRDFSEALYAVAVSQSAVALALVSLAPLVLVWYASTGEYQASLLFHAALFGLASLGGQLALRRAYRPLIARSGRHRLMLRAWIAIYAFVGIALGWTLRPFLGAPGEPVTFFRKGEWENAYVVVARLIWSVIRG